MLENTCMVNGGGECVQRGGAALQRWNQWDYTITFFSVPSKESSRMNVSKKLSGQEKKKCLNNSEMRT